MPSEPYLVTRKALYEQIWSSPMIHVCKLYGISNVGLGKLCKRNNIPRPYRGYWTQKAAGQQPHRIPLPNPEQDPTIKIQPYTPSPELSPEIKAVFTADIDDIQPVPVRDNLRGCHTLVRRMHELVNGTETDWNGFLRFPNEIPLDLRVSKTAAHRALRIMDALLRHLEERHHAITEGPTVDISGIPIKFCISEGTHMVQEEPKEHDLTGTYSFAHKQLTTKRVPNGELVLQIGGRNNYYWIHGSRHTWRDGKTKRLEEMLPQFVQGLVTTAARLKELELEEQRRETIRLEEEKKRQVLLKKRAAIRAEINAEKAKIKNLLEEADNWRRSMDLRAYIDAKAKQYLDLPGTAKAKEDFAEWKKWASDQADRIDPLSKNPASILDMETSEIMREDDHYHPWHH